MVKDAEASEQILILFAGSELIGLGEERFHVRPDSASVLDLLVARLEFSKLEAHDLALQRQEVVTRPHQLVLTARQPRPVLLRTGVKIPLLFERKLERLQILTNHRLRHAAHHSITLSH